MRASEAVADPVVFHFASGCLCLDFANTRSWRPSAAPHERLHHLHDLVRWGERAHLLAPAQAARLRVIGRRGGAGATLLRDATRLRAALHATVSVEAHA